MQQTHSIWVVQKWYFEESFVCVLPQKKPADWLFFAFVTDNSERTKLTGCIIFSSEKWSITSSAVQTALTFNCSSVLKVVCKHRRSLEWVIRTVFFDLEVGGAQRGPGLCLCYTFAQ